MFQMRLIRSSKYRFRSPQRMTKVDISLVGRWHANIASLTMWISRCQSRAFFSMGWYNQRRWEIWQTAEERKKKKKKKIFNTLCFYICEGLLQCWSEVTRRAIVLHFHQKNRFVRNSRGFAQRVHFSRLLLLSHSSSLSPPPSDFFIQEHTLVPNKRPFQSVFTSIDHHRLLET